MFRSLKYRNFRLFFYGQFFSLIGSWMQQTAQSWLVYRLTKDPLMLGLVVFLGQFPVFLFGFYAGYIVDRREHLGLVRLTQALAMLQAAVLAVLAFTGHVAVWHVIVLSLFLGIVSAFDIPARQVLIGELVDTPDRHNAIALNSTIVNASRIVGPAFAGLLIGWIGESWCFALNAASYLFVIVALSFMHPLRRMLSHPEGSLWQEVGDGLAYAMGLEPVRLLFGLLAVFGLAGLPIFTLLPVFAEGVLRSGARGMGILSSFSGLGATLGALMLARRRGSGGMGSVIIYNMFLFALVLLGLAFSTSFPLSCVLFLGVGYSAISAFAGTNICLQELSSDHYRGRIMSFYSMLFIGLAPLGSFIVGSLTSRWGLTPTVVLQAALCAAAAGLYLRRLPRLLDPLGLPKEPLERPDSSLAHL